jgi:hypothetical protein
MMQVVSRAKLNDDGWQFVFNTNESAQVLTNKKHIKKWGQEAEVVMKTVPKNPLKFDFSESTIAAIFQRYRIDCQKNVVQIDTEQYSSTGTLLLKSNAYGPNAVQSVLPASTGSLAYKLGCEE